MKGLTLWLVPDGQAEIIRQCQRIIAYMFFYKYMGSKKWGALNTFRKYINVYKLKKGQNSLKMALFDYCLN